MSISRQIKKLEHYEIKHRSGLERIATLMLTALTIFSVAGLGHDDERRRAAKEAVNPIMATFSSAEKVEPAEKNETVRMPIKFDDGLRAPATAGQ
jgi:hypothetical protein